MDTKTAVTGSITFSAIASAIGSALGCRRLKNKMKSVRTQTDALRYTYGATAGLVMRASYDQFINTTITRVPIRVESDDNDWIGWSGGTTVDSGGFSGHSGKF